MEIWKDVVWYEGLYQVSNMWNVKSLDTRVKSCHNSTYIKQWEQLKPILTKNGYIRVCFSIGRIKKYFTIHRLVAQAFIPNPENKPQVNHINWIRDDNRVENLEWCTASENHLHKFRVLWYNVSDKHIKQCINNNIKYKSKEVIQYTLNWEKIKIWDSVSDITRKLWFHQWNISSCARWERNIAHWFIWRYKKD